MSQAAVPCVSGHARRLGEPYTLATLTCVSLNVTFIIQDVQHEAFQSVCDTFAGGQPIVND